MEFKDYYATLELKKDAGDKEIKQAFRKLARKWHPDVNPNNREAAEAKFKEINEAHEVLSDPEKRKAYDQIGANWRQFYDAWKQQGGQGEPDWKAFSQQYGAPRRGRTGNARSEYRAASEDDLRDLFGEEDSFSDFFHTFFGGNQAPGGSQYEFRRSAPTPRARDREFTTEISLAEAINGGSRTIQAQTADGSVRRIEAKIPAGVADGQRIRLRGQGEVGPGGRNGDLYLVVRYRDDPRFEVKGDDLQTRIVVPLTTAVLGGETPVQTPTKRVMLTIPAETQDGKSIRLRGQGMPKKGTSGDRGDLMVEVHVSLPQRLTERERELFRQLAAARDGATVS